MPMYYHVYLSSDSRHILMSHSGFLQELNVSKIHHPITQLRMDLDNVQDLAISIKQHGLLQPIVVRPKQHGYEVVAGNRRLAAIRLLKARKISCHIVELSDKEAYEVALVENVQHKTMNPIEEAMAFNHYVESFGWGGISELARRIGKSQEFVTKRIQLLRLPEKVREEIIRQRMTPSVALEMLPLDKGAMEGFADFLIQNPLTKDEVRHIVRASKSEYSNKNSLEENIMETKNIQHEKELYLLDKALRKSIAVMKSTLVNFDDIVNNVNDEWILKELLMQYRMIVHGDIDTFLKLRKRLMKKVPKEYFTSQEEDKMKKSTRSSDINNNNERPQDDGSLHIWTTKGIWQ
jgi:ParB family transcriptional regulator, chromosome partitioning protein